MATTTVTTVSGVVQIDGNPAARTVRAFSYDAIAHQIDGGEVVLAKSLGHAKSDPVTGAYEISLLGGYSADVFVVAFDDYGLPFTPGLALAIGQRVHPTMPNGYVYECDAGGNLPEEEPAWSTDTETSQLIGTASVLPRPFYRPVVHGPIRPVAAEAPSNVVALLHFDGANGSTLITDEAGHTVTAVGNAQISTAASKFGGSSLRTAGGGRALLQDHADFDLGDGDFTIEFFVRPDGTTADQVVVRKGDGNNYSPFLFFASKNNMQFFSSSNGTAWSIGPVSCGTISSAGFTHIAVTRQAGSLKTFNNGALIATIGYPAAVAVNAAPISIGASSGGEAPFSGYIDDLRIIKGNAQYTAAFTVPTEPLTL